MRILHVIPAVASRYGGPSAGILGMCRALDAAGCETLMVTTDADGPGRLDVPLERVIDHQGVRALFFARQLSESFKYSAPLARWLRVHAGEFDVAHVHAVFSHASLAGGRACRQHRVPYLVRPLGTLDPWSLDRHRWRKQALMALGAKHLLQRAAAVHFTSRGEQERVEGRLPWLATGVVSPLGIDDDWFSAPHGDGRRQNLVVSLSRLDPKKGVDLLIAAFHEAVARGLAKDWRLAIAGDGAPDYVDQLRRRAASGPAADQIAFHGWVSGSARQALLRSAALFALPSTQENFGVALVEALASGIPAVVAPGVTLAADLEAAEAGWVCARDVASLAATLATATADEGELARRGARAAALAGRFRWTEVARSLTMIYGDMSRDGHSLASLGTP